MIRWLGQRDEFRCGPIALVNIMKWAGIKEFEGHRVNEKLAKGYLSVRCWTDKEGTFNYHFEIMLRSLPGLKITKYTHSKRHTKRLSRRDIKKHLKSGGIVLLDTPWWNSKKRKHEWHYSLLVDVITGGRLYYIINHSSGITRGILRGRTLAKMLKHSSTIIHFIEKDQP